MEYNWCLDCVLKARNYHVSSSILVNNVSCSNNRHPYDADWRIWIFDDLFETIWLFITWTNFYHCHTRNGMDNSDARICTHGRFIYNQTHIFGVRNPIYNFN